MNQRAVRRKESSFLSERNVKNSTLACPCCQGPLVLGADLRCETCRRSWDFLNGVPAFASSRYYWGEIPQGDMIALNESARKVGWRKAAAQKLQPAYSHIYDYIVDEARADFRFLLPLHSRSKVLDVGAGFGTISFGLQPHSGWVTAVELIPERAEFIEIRRAQEGIQNMEVAIADGLALPFAPETFDFIVVNGYLEWVGLADPARNPRLLQKEFLSRLHRLLRPGGAVYIGIENRFGYDNFLGAKDHSGLRYTSLAPRWMADFACRFYLKEPYRVDQVHHDYRTYTYGKRGYKKILAESGFQEAEFFMPHPGYNRPVELISLDHPYPLRFFLQNTLFPASRLGRLKKKAALWGTSIGLTSFFAPHFSIVAWKERRYD